MSLLGKLFGSVTDLFTGHSSDFLGDTASNAAGVATGGGSSYLPLASAGLSLLGGINTNQANSAQAQRQMQFQQYNSDTAYQRAMADMTAAGLNPMLAYQQGGASTPSGASATMSDPITPAISTATALNKNISEVANLKANATNLAATTSNTNADTELTKAQTAKTILDTQNSAKTGKNLDIQNVIDNAGVAGATNQSKADQTWYGRNIKPYLPDLLSHSAKSAASGGLGALFK